MKRRSRRKDVRRKRVRSTARSTAPSTAPSMAAPARPSRSPPRPDAPGGDAPAPAAYAPLAPVAAAVAAGIVLSEIGWIVRPWTLVAGGAAALLWLTLHFSGGGAERSFGTRRERWAAAALLLIAALAGAAARESRAVRDAADVEAWAGPRPHPVVARVRLDSAPRWRLAPRPRAPADGVSRATIVWVAVRDGRTWRPARGRATLSVRGGPLEYGAGDSLLLCGSVSQPGPPTNPGEFDEAAWRRQLGAPTHITADTNGLTLEASAPPWSAPRRLSRLRRRAEEALRRFLPPRQAGLAVAMILGRRDGLARDQRETFLHSGAAHLLAISGLHVGILAAAVWLVGRVGWLTRRQCCLAAAAAAAAYAVLAGARPPVLRAAALVACVAGARLLGRRVTSGQALSTAAILLLAWRPEWLWDTGAQLSFLAVFVLARAAARSASWGASPADPLDRLIWSARPWPARLVRKICWGLLRAGWASAAVWLATAPLVAWRFQLLAPVGVLLNPLVGPLVAAALILAFGVLALAWLPPAAAVSGAASGACLQGVEWLCGWAAGLPGAWFGVAAPSAAWVACAYALLGAWLIARRPPPSAQHSAFALWWAAAAVWLLWPALPRVSAPALVCTFLNVGHGTCVVIETPAGEVVVYDCGQLGAPGRAGETALRWLQLRGVRRVDTVILSHADADHYNGVSALVAKCSVRRVLVGPRMFAGGADASGTPPQEDPVQPAAPQLDEGLRRLRDLLFSEGIPCETAVAGTGALFRDAAVEAELLHPAAADQPDSDNADSLVLRIQFQGRSILLPGDLEGSGQLRLLTQTPAPTDVVMAPHHGSRHSEPAAVYRWCRPRWVVVSGGWPRAAADDLAGAADAELAAVAAAQPPAGAGVQWRHTALDGAVQVTIRRRQVQVRTWRRGRWQFGDADRARSIGAAPP